MWSSIKFSPGSSLLFDYSGFIHLHHRYEKKATILHNFPLPNCGLCSIQTIGFTVSICFMIMTQFKKAHYGLGTESGKALFWLPQIFEHHSTMTTDGSKKWALGKTGMSVCSPPWSRDVCVCMSQLCKWGSVGASVCVWVRMFDESMGLWQSYVACKLCGIPHYKCRSPHMRGSVYTYCVLDTPTFNIGTTLPSRHAMVEPS